jgi:Fe2+ transport system protein FeoA
VSDPAVRPLAELRVGAGGTVVDVGRSGDGRTDRLLSLGVTPGARVRVLQTFPGVVFLCDQTELAVERNVARSIFVRVEQSVASGPELPTVEEDR